MHGEGGLLGPQSCEKVFMESDGSQVGYIYFFAPFHYYCRTSYGDISAS